MITKQSLDLIFIFKCDRQEDFLGSIKNKLYKTIQLNAIKLKTKSRKG